jgi:hypothetical protein
MDIKHKHYVAASIAALTAGAAVAAPIAALRHEARGPCDPRARGDNA